MSFDRIRARFALTPRLGLTPRLALTHQVTVAHLAVKCAAPLVLSWLMAGLAAADRDLDHAGGRIYQSVCADCHGVHGEGVEDIYGSPLTGDRSIKSLAKLIDRTMPEDDPEACAGEQAVQVAEYIYHEFYSLEARQRKGLAAIPRIELSRLTIPQYRNAVADLIARFTPTPDHTAGVEEYDDDDDKRNPDDQRELTVQAAALLDTVDDTTPGLIAEYFQSKKMSKADELIDRRIDRRLEFDFADQSPVEGISADQFAVIWFGSLATTETGQYEFRLRSPNGARLYVNTDPVEGRRKLRDDSSKAGQAALIDAWVSSGNMRTTEARMFLLGGRRYPIRLEFFKYLDETAAVRLEWKPPNETWQVLDHRYLRAAAAPRLFSVTTPFPADDRSLGYERGSAVSQEWQIATMNGAIDAATEVVERLPLLAGLDDWASDDSVDETKDESADDVAERSADQLSDRAERISDFLAEFAATAFRRPLSDDEGDRFRMLVRTAQGGSESAVRNAVIEILLSPEFLYADLTASGQPPTQHAVAARLALQLWDSIPNQELSTAADRGKLGTPAEIQQQAERMIEHPLARAKMRRFFLHWLEIEDRDLAKDDTMFPDFDEAVVADLRHSLELFLEGVIWSERSDYRELLLADYLMLNDRLRRLYAADAEPVEEANNRAGGSEPPAEFVAVQFAADERSGVLTHPYLLSAFSYHNNSSPIHRGVFLTRNIVGRSLKPPPVAVAFKEDEFDPDLTMRQKITQLTRDQACMSCHKFINSLGFALENFDAVGRWRSAENDKPIDSISDYTTVEGETIRVRNARDVANLAAASQTAQRAFIGQMFQHVVKQDPAAYGDQTLANLHRQFAADNFNIRKLVVRIAVLAAAPDAATNSLANGSE